MVLHRDCVNRDTEIRAGKHNESHQSHGNRNGPSFSPGPILSVSNNVRAIKLDKFGFLLGLRRLCFRARGSFLDVCMKILS